MNLPDLLCIAIYALVILIGVLQVVKLIKFQFEKLRRND